MIAAATFIVGVAREVMTWPSFELIGSTRTTFRSSSDFAPEPHSSRNGWVARFSSFAENPFVADVNEPLWTTRGGDRALASRHRAPASLATSGRRSSRLGDAAFAAAHRGGDATDATPSLLELDDRPPAVRRASAGSAPGRTCFPSARSPARATSASSSRHLPVESFASNGDWYTPTGMRGWSHVVFRRDRDRTRHVFSLDFLLEHLDDWDVASAERAGPGDSGAAAVRSVVAAPTQRRQELRSVVPALRLPPVATKCTLLLTPGHSVRREAHSHDDRLRLSADRPSPRRQTRAVAAQSVRSRRAAAAVEHGAERDHRQ